MAVTKHPSSRQRVGRLTERFLKLRKEHEAAVNRMWVGTLAMNFTDEELGLITDLLCPNDQSLLRLVREPHGGRQGKG